MNKRKCRICSKSLPKSRYFNCVQCVPPSSDTSDTFYETEELDEHLVSMCEDLDIEEGEWAYEGEM